MVKQTTVRMRNNFLVACTVILAFIASSNAFPPRKSMVYAPQPSQWYAPPQHMMYVQYVQPSRSQPRSTQAASALVAGESVATGTYLKDCGGPSDTYIASNGKKTEELAVKKPEELSLSAIDGHAVQSVAEAYPEENVIQTVDGTDETVSTAAADEQIINVKDDMKKSFRNYDIGNTEDGSTSTQKIERTTEVGPSAPILPAINSATRSIPRKKKIHVELEQSPESGEINNEEDNAVIEIAKAEEEGGHNESDFIYGSSHTQLSDPRRSSVRKPSKPSSTTPPKAITSGTFFPIDFGGTSGGAIAIANSFSTGESGSAASHAIAYGSPDAVRARIKSSKFQ